jgi:hypothetical protein
VLVPSCQSCWSTNAPWDGAGSRMSHLASSSTHSVPTSSISTEEMMRLIGYRQLLWGKTGIDYPIAVVFDYTDCSGGI